MSSPRRVLVIHTAFPGDIVLCLPLCQALRRHFPSALLSFLVIPRTAPLLSNHPAVDEVIEYDKQGSGVRQFLPLVGTLRERVFDVALVPHRSLRSAGLAYLARVPTRIGFSTSAGRFLMTHTVEYDPAAHESDRNLRLLQPLGVEARPGEAPVLYPGAEDVVVIDNLLRTATGQDSGTLPKVALAPGSVWATKRWPADRYASLARLLLDEGYLPVLVGGEADRELCDSIAAALPTHIVNASGRLTLLQSAELLRRCAVTVSNDSAPVHMSVAVGTPVVAIFGPTIPGFGFAPRGHADTVVETEGLVCRPCSVHGGRRCPVGTFECMLRIAPEQVLTHIRRVLHAAHRHG